MNKKVHNRFEGGRRKYIWTRVGIGCVVMLFVLVCTIIFLKSFAITDVKVDGNYHYTKEQIENIVLSDKTWKNSIFLWLKYRNKSITDIPFVERIDVTVENKNTICVNVYEKALAGYVSYLGTYMYFDKDGIVVENSGVLTPSIPEVSGLKFNHVILHEPLPVEDREVFQKILNMTNLLKKHNISATKIQFNSMGEMNLYFDGVKVLLGSETEIDEKIMRLAAILPSLEGKTGTLHMETYSESSKDITFESDNSQKAEEEMPQPVIQEQKESENEDSE